MEKIEDWVTAFGFFLITRWSVHPHPASLFEDGRILPVDGDGAVRNIAWLPEIRSPGRDLDKAGRSTRTQLDPRVHRIGDGQSVQRKRIDVDAGFERPKRCAPNAVGVFSH